MYYHSRSPGAARQLSWEQPVVAEEHSQPLGDGEDDLSVGDVLEHISLGPVRPQELALLLAAWTQTPKLAREIDEELMPAVRASHSGNAVVEHAAIEIAVDRWLDAAAQVAMLPLKLLLVDEQEAFELLRESSIENRAFGMARSIDSGSCRRFRSLHSTEGRRNWRPPAGSRPQSIRAGGLGTRSSEEPWCGRLYSRRARWEAVRLGT